MKLLEVATEIDLSDINLSDVNENLNNAEAILIAVKNEFLEFIEKSGINIVLAVILLIAGWKLANVFSSLIKKEKILKKLEPTKRSFFRSFATIFIKVLLVIIVLAIMGVPVTSMVTILSSCAIAIGLALQNSLSNIAGGFIITAFKPFVVGDYIKFGEHEGTVKSINIFYTKISTFDNKMIIIPNGNISSDSLVDYNAYSSRRVEVEISAAYSEDSDKVKQALLDVAASNENVLQEPAPSAVILSFDDSAVAYQLRVWCNTDVYWDVKYDLTEKVKKTFDERKIQIPFPQMDVHITKE